MQFLGCILTDIKMPEMNGVDFYKIIKKEKPDIPVVMMTAYTEVGRGAVVRIYHPFHKIFDVLFYLC